MTRVGTPPIERDDAPQPQLPLADMVIARRLGSPAPVEDPDVTAVTAAINDFTTEIERYEQGRETAERLAEVAANIWMLLKPRLDAIVDRFSNSPARQLSAAFTEGLGDLADVLGLTARDTVDHDHLRHARALGQRFVAQQRWSRVVGERVDTATLRQRLGVSRQALDQRVTSGSLLAVPGDITRWYPTWQFTDSPDGLTVRPVVARIVAAFRDHLDDEFAPLTVISWADSPQPELDDMSPVDWIRDDRDDDPIVTAARRAAAALAR